MLTDKDIKKLAGVFPTKDFRQAVDDSLVKFRSEILSSYDKLSIKLDIILAEQQAITVGSIKFQPPQV